TSPTPYCTEPKAPRAASYTTTGGTTPESTAGSLLPRMWNPLSKHQSKSNPFRLTRVKPGPATYDHLAKLSRFRREEIDAFVEGLFGDRDELDFPGTAHKAIDSLGEIRATFAGAHELCACPPAPASTDSLNETLRNLRDLVVVAEAEINTIIQANKAARAALLETYNLEKPPMLH
ncbi:hypothetical protein, partial [uncultured Jannaschia sp.]|uniref:hypothetical protein n=1 Tax=uncultured Jannaschia sp. TaxID=293347 RepID=UPI002635B813